MIFNNQAIDNSLKVNSTQTNFHVPIVGYIYEFGIHAHLFWLIIFIYHISLYLKLLR